MCVPSTAAGKRQGHLCFYVLNHGTRNMSRPLFWSKGVVTHVVYQPRSKGFRQLLVGILL